jgi:hypothetical protein
MEVEYTDATGFLNTSKRTMPHTPDVSPVKGLLSIAPLRKLPVPPSRKLSYSPGSPQNSSPTDDNTHAIPPVPSEQEAHDPGDTSPLGERL